MTPVLLKKRSLRIWLFCLFGLMFTSLGTTAAPVGPTAKKPNIIFILLDDLDNKITEPFLDNVMPFTMSLKSEGIYFKNAYAPTPLCCPARSTILTGKYGHNTKVLNNSGEYGGYSAFKKYGNEENSVAVMLQQQGYKTAAFGKYLNGYAEHNPKLEIPIGWSTWHVFAFGSYYSGYNYSILEKNDGAESFDIKSYSRDERDYSTDVISQKATHFIRDSAKASSPTPFFMYLTPTAPHGPMNAAMRHRNLAQQWENTMPTETRDNYFSDGDTIMDKPFWLRQSWRKRQEAQHKIQGWWVKRLGSLYAVDEMVKDIVDELKSNKLWDNTIIIITSDNGYSLGSHSVAGKQVPYEESINIPLIITGGKNLNLKQGTTDSNYVILCDHGPTFLELAGARASDAAMDGTSLVPLIKKDSPRTAWRNDFLIEFGGDVPDGPQSLEALLDNDDALLLSDEDEKGFRVAKYQGIRGRIAFFANNPDKLTEFLYVEWFDPRYKDAHGKMIPEYELYNLEDDPSQLHNLLYFEPKKYEKLKSKLHQRLEKLKACAGKSCKDL